MMLHFYPAPFESTLRVDASLPPFFGKQRMKVALWPPGDVSFSVVQWKSHHKKVGSTIFSYKNDDRIGK